LDQSPRLIQPERHDGLGRNSADLQVSPDELKAAIILFHGLLDEQQRRLFAGLESIRLGQGGDTLLGDFLGLDAHTVARGRCATRPPGIRASRPEMSASAGSSSFRDC